ncbi:hypothetical protein [Flavobacterium sp.]|uniref:hypothetical protein n=1 Tax=Flavobacterium sp. TaxID=239 RepID=UPI004034F12F
MQKQTMMFALLGVVAVATALQSCKKGCYKCSTPWDSNNFSIVCEDEFDSHKQFADYLKYLEASGYDCKNK